MGLFVLGEAKIWRKRRTNQTKIGSAKLKRQCLLFAAFVFIECAELNEIMHRQQKPASQTNLHWWWDGERTREQRIIRMPIFFSSSFLLHMFPQQNVRRLQMQSLLNQAHTASQYYIMLLNLPFLTKPTQASVITRKNDNDDNNENKAACDDVIFKRSYLHLAPSVSVSVFVFLTLFCTCTVNTEFIFNTIGAQQRSDDIGLGIVLTLLVIRLLLCWLFVCSGFVLVISLFAQFSFAPFNRILCDFHAKCSINAFIFVLLFVRLVACLLTFFVALFESCFCTFFFYQRFVRKLNVVSMQCAAYFVIFIVAHKDYAFDCVRAIFISHSFFFFSLFSSFSSALHPLRSHSFSVRVIVMRHYLTAMLNTYATIAHLNMSDDSHFGALFQNTLGVFFFISLAIVCCISMADFSFNLV